jgi:hypothetical protein
MGNDVALGKDTDLWAKMTGKIPRVARSLYEAPHIANLSDYDVRYSSWGSGSRTFPCRNHHTLTDHEIEDHYYRLAKEKGVKWDRTYTIWVGPPTYTKLPRLVREDVGESSCPLVNTAHTLLEAARSETRVSVAWDSTGSRTQAHDVICDNLRDGDRGGLAIPLASRQCHETGPAEDPPTPPMDNSSSPDCVLWPR